MDTLHDLEQLLFEDFRNFEENLEMPALSVAARKKVAARKAAPVAESKSWYLPEWLFNFKLKFMHAVLFVLLFETAVIFETRQPGWKAEGSGFSVSVAGLAAVQNSTLLCCPVTYNIQ